MCDACIEWDGKTWHKKPGGSYYQARILLHREIWKSALGPIPEGFHVHHRNGDIHDNRIENLELLSSSDHNRLHCREKLAPYQAKATAAAHEAARRNREERIRIRQLTCVACGKKYRSGERSPAAYCSVACMERLRSGAFDGEQKSCERCGAKFRATKRAQRYCSRACNQRAAGARAVSLFQRSVVCAHCKLEFSSRRTNARFCSRPCALAFHDGNRLRGKVTDRTTRFRPDD